MARARKPAPKSVKSAAVVTIMRAADMTPKGRRQIAAWLRKHADMLTEHGKDYSKRFTGRYLYGA